MIPVSDRFLATLRGSHAAPIVAKVVPPGQIGTNPYGAAVPILDGSAVRLDGTAKLRGVLTLVTEASLWPTQADSLLAPYGNELWVARGVSYGGTEELAPLGFFRINTPDQDDANGGPITVEAVDRMAGIVDAELVAPRQYAATTTFGAVVSNLVGEVYPWATIEWDDPGLRDSPIGRQAIAERDRYQFLQELFTSVGKIGYWDHRGILVIHATPPVTTPVWTVDYAGVQIRLSRRLTRVGVQNGVMVSGEGLDTAGPVWAGAIDDNPASPTYWHGPFGQVPYHHSSPLITTIGQAEVAAAEMLRRRLGLPYEVDFVAVVNPALQPHDPVRVVHRDGTESVHVLETLTVPLAADQPMPATTREQTVILIGSV